MTSYKAIKEGTLIRVAIGTTKLLCDMGYEGHDFVLTMRGPDGVFAVSNLTGDEYRELLWHMQRDDYIRAKEERVQTLGD